MEIKPERHRNLWRQLVKARRLSGEDSIASVVKLNSRLLT